MPAQLANSEASRETDALRRLRSQLVSHPIYESVQTVDGLRLFMREHVFAVWDFMSLLKRLQQVVSCCSVPWLPVADGSLARFINEIVLGEECDEDGQGGYCSHFELYLAAMKEIGADTDPIESFVARVRGGDSIDQALGEMSILQSTRAFVRSTMQVAQSGKPHEVAAAFFYGREDVIPDMFARLVEGLTQVGIPVERMRHYLQRHIELDANDHGPLAKKLVRSLCAGQESRESEVTHTAIAAIRQRIDLWDGILAAVQRL